MADSLANYHAIPPSEDHGAELGSRHSDGPYSTRQRMLFESATRWTCFFLGCAILLPWNALTNATPFFLSRMADSPFYSTFSSWLCSVFTFIKLLCLSYCTITSKQSSLSRRIYASISAAILLTTCLCLSTFFRGTPSAFFSFALSNAVSMAVASSYIGAAVFAWAALLGPPFLQSVLSGQAAIGVAISAIQVVSAVVLVWGSPGAPTVLTVIMETDDSDYLAEGITARIFLGVSTLLLVMILSAYAWLTRQTFFRLATGAKQPVTEDTDDLSVLAIPDDDRRTTTGSSALLYRILKRNWVYMLSIAYVYAVTLALYPTITVRVQSVNSAVPHVFFTAVHFLVFNVGDLIGRRVCAFPCFAVWSGNKILLMALTRTLFIPLTLLCNVHRPTITRIPPIVDSDALFMCILFAMGYTNGFVSCTAILALSSPEHNPGMEGHREDVDVAAALGMTFMMVGLVSGALSSFGVEAML